jgi:hypothetical protein
MCSYFVSESDSLISFVVATYFFLQDGMVMAPTFEFLCRWNLFALVTVIHPIPRELFLLL